MKSNTNKCESGQMCLDFVLRCSLSFLLLYLFRYLDILYRYIDQNRDQKRPYVLDVIYFWALYWLMMVKRFCQSAGQVLYSTTLKHFLPINPLSSALVPL